MAQCRRGIPDETTATGALRHRFAAVDRSGGEIMAHRASAGGKQTGLGFEIIMQTVNFDEELEKILMKDARYHRDAYFFVREALDHTQKLMGKVPKDEIRHVSGQQLLNGIRDFGLGQFGPMTLTVLNEWGLNVCEDFGEIVFNMVENSLLAKTEKDTRDDFQNGYDFTDAFRKPFWPQSRLDAEKKTVVG